MHDWTIIGVNFDWLEGVIKLHFFDQMSLKREVVCFGVIEFQMSRRCEWGMSVSVNSAERLETNSSTMLKIEIQSGDQILVECKNIVGFPV